MANEFDPTQQIILQTVEGIKVWLAEWSAVHEAQFLPTGALDFPIEGATSLDPPPGRMRLCFDPVTNKFKFRDETGAEIVLATESYHDRGYLARKRRSYIESEFIDFGIFAEGVVAIAAGTGATNGTASGVDKTNHPGIWCLETGTTSVGRVFIISSSTRGYQVGGAGLTRIGSIVKTGVFLSTALEEYVDRVGFFSINPNPNTILAGIGFEYQFDQNGGRWQGLCVDGGGETSVDLGVVVKAETWYDLELEVNAAADSVEFFIDGVSRGTVAANIPSGGTFNLFYNFHIMKLAGGGNRSFYIDHYYIYQEVTR